MSRMSAKRRGAMLTLLLLLQLCHGHPAPPEMRILPQADVISHVEVVSTAENNISVLHDFMTENDVDLTGINDTFCGNPDELDFYQGMKGTPGAGELYGLVSSILMTLGGCREDSALRLDDLSLSSQISSDVADAVIEMIEALEGEEDNQTFAEVNQTSVMNGLQEPSDILDEMINKTVENVKNMTHQLRMMESLIPEENRLGYVECQWSRASPAVSATCSVNNTSDHWLPGNFLQAKLECEKNGNQCVGFVMRHNGTSYELIKECNFISSSANQETTNLPSFNETTWLKICPGTKNSTGNVTEVLQRPLTVSHVLRRSVDDEAEASVIVYEDDEYRGANIVLSGAVKSLDSWWKTKISSFRFPQVGWSVVAFEEPNFMGRQTAYVGDTNWVGDKMNDKTSSLIVLPYRLDELCFTVFEHTNFQGENRRMCGDQDFTSSSWNKKISSLQVESEGCGVILYDRSHVGDFKWFSGSVAWVGDDWNDKTSSIQIRPWILQDHEGRIQPTTVLYADSNYRGARTSVKGTTEWIGHEMNDKASSVQCEGDCSVLVFEHRNYEGRATLYDGSQTSLGNFNDMLSSVLVLMERVCVTLYEHSNYRGRSFQRCSDVQVFPSEWNDRVSSLIVDCPYCSVIVYEHTSYQGDYKAFTGRVPNVGNHWNDFISSLQIRPWKLNSEDYKTKNCVNQHEKKAHDIIQWIPLLGTIYNLASSIGYGAAGCQKVAQDRATDMALDLVMDIATVATGGAAGIAAYGVKTGVKAGVKVGLHAAKKALTSTIKNAAKKVLKSSVKIAKRGITGNVKSLSKQVVKSTKNIAKAARELPGAVKNGVKTIGRGVSEVSQKGIAEATKTGATKLKKVVQKKFDDIADSAGRQIDKAKAPSKSGKLDLCRRKRMINASGCKKNQKPKPEDQKPNPHQELVQRHLDAQKRQLSEARRIEAQNFFNEINGSPNQFKHKMAPGFEIDAIQFEIPSDAVTKDVLHKLAYYDDFIKKGAELLKPTGKSEISKFALKVNMRFGNEPFEFVMTSARDRQIFIGFTNKIDSSVSHSYDGIVKVLDSSDPTEMQRNARAVLDAINAPGGHPIDWGDMTLKQREAAKELIVLTHVAEGAVPDPTQVNNMLDTNMRQRRKPNSVQGGIGGIDKSARSYFRRIKDDPTKMSFSKAFNTNNGEFIIARIGGKKKLKATLYTPQCMDKETKLIIQQEKNAMSDSSMDLRKRRSVRAIGGK